MMFLAPWFLVGAAAISFPVLFHLIRRTVRNERPFSTIMFLPTTPPLPTRRSRLDDLPLLLVRATILALLAIAFTRPFLRQETSVLVGASKSRTAILLDASASMQRRDRWQNGIKIADQLMQESQPQSALAGYVVTDSLVTWIDQWERSSTSLPPEASLANLRPTWGTDDLPSAIRSVIDRHSSLHEQDGENIKLTLHVISDFASGASSSWRSIEWPDGIDVRLHPVETPPRHQDAWLELLPSNLEENSSQHRVRISNSLDSVIDRFRVVDQSRNQSQEIQLPPGRSRVIAVDRSDRPIELTLEGDSTTYGNSLTLPAVENKSMSVFCDLGRDDESAWILEQAFKSLSYPEIDWTENRMGEGLSTASCVVQLSPPPPESVEALLSFVDTGGRLLIGLDREVNAESAAAWKAWLDQLAPSANFRMVESPLDDFCLIKGANPQHSLLNRFAVDSFRDFGEIHVWKRRELAWDGAQVEIAATFEDQAPWLVSIQRGNGMVLISTTGWTREESELARSSRFSPLMTALAGLDQVAPDFRLWESGRYTGPTVNATRFLTKGETEVVVFESDSDLEPGLYRPLEIETQRLDIKSQPEESSAALTDWIVVQPPASEWFDLGNTIDEISAELPKSSSQPRSAAVSRRLQALDDQRQEQTQSWWKFLLVMVIGLCGFESWLAWRSGRKVKGAGSLTGATIETNS